MPLLRNRNFSLLWAAQLISGTGDVLYSVGILVAVFQTTGSALQTAGVMVANTLPPFLLGPFAGAWVDRFPKRTVMIAMDLLRAVMVGLMLIVVRQDGFSLWKFYLIVAGLSAASALYLPARQAIVPSLVPPRDLVRANGLIIGTNQAAYAIGYALGGLLIVSISLEVFVIVDLLTFVTSAVLTGLIRLDLATGLGEAGRAAIGLWQSIREGAVYLRDHAIARPLVVMEGMEHVPHGIWTTALMLVFVEEALGGTPTDWGWQNAAFFGGQIFGAVLATALASRLAKRPGMVIIGNAFLMSALTFIYALSPNNLVASVLAFIYGPPFSLRDVSQDSLLQTKVDRGVLGRIFAMRHMLWNLTFMISGLGFAWLADFVPVRLIYTIGGGLYLLTAIYAASQRALRESSIDSDALAELPA